jgi:hypothetical protein
MPNNNVAYGFTGLQHLFSQRIVDVGITNVFEAITLTTEEYNRQVTELLGQFVFSTVEYKRRYNLPGASTLQPIDEYGIPVPVREGAWYEVGLPIQGGATAFGENRVARALMTVEEANRRMLMVQRADADWLRRHILGALLDNTSWTYTDPQYGNLTVQPLANGDSVSYYLTGQTALGTDDHYVAQAAAISDAANPFPTIAAKLKHHPGNRGPYVVYISSSLKATVTALAEFLPVRDPQVALGNASDSLVGTIDPGLGDETLGYLGDSGLWVVEWNVIPSGYMIAVDRNPPDPIMAMRQYPAAEIQGLFIEGFSPDGALRETRFLRYCGFGILNRISAVVAYIGGGSYVIPTGYATPLLV